MCCVVLYVFMKQLCFQVFTVYSRQVSYYWARCEISQLWQIYKDLIVSFDLTCSLLYSSNYTLGFFWFKKTQLWYTSQHTQASHRGGYNPNLISWSKAHFFLLFCNNSSNENKNEIPSRNRRSMISIHHLGHMWWFFPHYFTQAFACTRKHTVLQMPHMCKQDAGCTAVTNVLMYKLRASKNHQHYQKT